MALSRAGSAFASRLSRAGGAGSLATRCISSSAKACTSIHPEEELYNRQRPVLSLGDRVPSLAPDAYVAPSAVIVGDVDVFDGASVWHGAVLRGDLNSIRVGAFSTVGERAVLHAAASSPTGLPAATDVGRSVTIGAGAMLRSATVGDGSAVGAGAILLEGSIVEAGAVLAGGALLPPGRRVPSGQLWAGSPARFVRDLTKDEKHDLPAVASSATALASEHAAELLPQSDAFEEAEALRAVLSKDAALVEAADLGSPDHVELDDPKQYI